MFLPQDEGKKIKDIKFRLDQRAGDIGNDFSDLAGIEEIKRTDTNKAEIPKKIDLGKGKRKKFFAEDSQTFSTTLRLRREDAIIDNI